MTSCILFLIFSFFNCTFLIFFLYLVKCERSETPSPGKKNWIADLFIIIFSFRKLQEGKAMGKKNNCLPHCLCRC